MDTRSGSIIGGACPHIGVAVCVDILSQLALRVCLGSRREGGSLTEHTLSLV